VDRRRLVLIDVALVGEADLDVDADQPALAPVGAGVADRDDLEQLRQPRRRLLALSGVPSSRIFTMTSLRGGLRMAVRR
jgi:hypothetical protein